MAVAAEPWALAASVAGVASSGLTGLLVWARDRDFANDQRVAAEADEPTRW